MRARDVRRRFGVRQNLNPRPRSRAQRTGGCWRRSRRCRCVLSVASLDFHASYGYFIDEFYYIACAERLAFGYVDHPPLAPVVLAVHRDPCSVSSLLGLRLPAFLAASATVWVTGVTVWRLGGPPVRHDACGPLGRLLARSARDERVVSMNAFEPLIWWLVVADDGFQGIVHSGLSRDCGCWSGSSWGWRSRTNTPSWMCMGGSGRGRSVDADAPGTGPTGGSGWARPGRLLRRGTEHHLANRERLAIARVLPQRTTAEEPAVAAAAVARDAGAGDESAGSARCG